jgi:hypothetical protein
MLPDVNLKKLFNRAFKYGVLTALFGPMVLGVTQCSRQNDYDAWDERALKSFAENTSNNYYWEYRQVRKVLEAIGAVVPSPPPPP